MDHFDQTETWYFMGFVGFMILPLIYSVKTAAIKDGNYN